MDLLRRRAREHVDRDQLRLDQRLEAAADDLDLLIDRQLPEADRLRRGHQDAQRPVAAHDRIGRHGGQHVADEVDLLGGEEALAAGVVGELPWLFRDPRNHRGQHQVELPPALARARFVVQPPHVALEQRLEQLAAERDHLVVGRQRSLLAVRVGLDALVHADDPAEPRRRLALVGAQAHASTSRGRRRSWRRPARTSASDCGAPRRRCRRAGTRPSRPCGTCRRRRPPAARRRDRDDGTIGGAVAWRARARPWDRASRRTQSPSG